jgi:hypothetical protein
MNARRIRHRPTAVVAFEAITIEGGLISPAMFARVAGLRGGGQTEADYGVPKGLTLRDELARYFRIGQALFNDLKVTENPSATATVRFAEELLRDVFGFTDIALVGTRRFGERQFAVTLEALDGRVPVVVVPPADDLDKPSEHLPTESRRRSAASAVQDWLNTDEESMWGFCTNGFRLRLLRDNASLTRPAYIEANLRAMFEEQAFADFAALWLLVHASRFGKPGTPASDCALERWREEGQKEGIAARDRLRDGVEAALLSLGNGFLAHPDNGALREKLHRGVLPLSDFFGQLLRLVYRLIFLLTAEDRELLHPPEAGVAARKLYRDGYSLSTLRDRAARRSAWDRHHDQWEGLLIIFTALARGEKRLALPALDGVFAPGALSDLEDTKLANRALMEAIWRLAWLSNKDSGTVPVNWRDMETEELGSVYESLLELTPQLNGDGRQLKFAEGGEAKGHARKTTGSYYTPGSLVQALLDSALDPVLDRIETEAEDVSAALLSVAVIDPACGSGHFLLAAARRIATRLARARTQELPSPTDYRHALRDVARACIYGVDRNPMAVELTKVALWIETVEPGKPLGFLDANIRCGDSLLGVFNLDALEQGIPDAAYKPLAGDDKEAARIAGRNNRTQREQKKQHELALAKGAAEFARAAHAIAAMPEDDVAGVEARASAYAQLRKRPGWWSLKTACDLYVTAFVTPKHFRKGALERAKTPDLVPTTGDLRGALSGHPTDRQLIGKAVDLAGAARAFHWPLEFPDVMAAGGFDVVLGNPPWEVMQLGEEEYFAQRSPEIAELAGATRKRAIAALEQENPALFTRYQEDKRRFEASNQFARESARFDLTARGKINTYALFAELFASLASERGRSGIIVPAGLTTDYNSSFFFRSLISEGRLIRSLAFDNQKRIFPAVHPDTPFTLLTMGRSHDLPEFASYLLEREHLDDSNRRYRLSAEDIARINPNTKTAPIFRSRADADLTAKIYARVPVLVDEAKGKDGNPWGVEFRQGLFNMTSDSGLFRTAAQLGEFSFMRDGSDWVERRAGERYLPLYEAKMIHQFDHRWATYDDGDSRDATLAEKQDATFEPTPRYWVPEREVWLLLSRLPKGFLDAVRAQDEKRTSLFVAQTLFGLQLRQAGYPAKPSNKWDIFGEWKAFVSSHRGLRDIPPTSIGLVGDNPPIMEPANANCLPAVPLDQIVSTAREKTAWYEVDPHAIETIVETVGRYRWLAEPTASLSNSADVAAFAEEFLEASCPRWLMGWRDITNATNERTVIAAGFPRKGVGNNLPLMFFPADADSRKLTALVGCLSSLACDFFARHKVGGTHLNFFIYQQLAVLPPGSFAEAELAFIVPRVLELTYTSHAMAPFARDVGFNGPPFKWDQDRRAQLRAELDAFFARAYGLTRDELRYILDPADVKGPDYPSETFRVLKKNELAKYGEYRTARLVLQAWDRLERGETADLALPVTITTPATALSIVPIDSTAVPDGAWAMPAGGNVRDKALAQIAAVLKSLPGPTPTALARRAALYALEPRLLTGRLEAAARAEWLRLVGTAAVPAVGITTLGLGGATGWGDAIRLLAATGCLIEDVAAQTWAPGTGLDAYYTDSWPQRAGFALQEAARILADESAATPSAQEEEGLRALAA